MLDHLPFEVIKLFQFFQFSYELLGFCFKSPSEFQIETKPSKAKIFKISGEAKRLEDKKLSGKLFLEVFWRDGEIVA